MRPDYNSYRFGFKELIAYLVAGCFFYLCFSLLLYNSLWPLTAIPLFFFFYLKFIKTWRIKAVKKELQQHFLIACEALVVAMRAGFSPERSLSEAGRDLKAVAGEKAAMVRELAYMESQLAVNVPLEKLLGDFAERSHLEDIKNFADVFAVGKRTGGRMDEILSMTVSHLKEKLEVQKDIEAEVASRRMELGIMCLMPWGILLYLRIFSWDYMEVLYKSAAGRLVVTVCFLLFLISWYWGQRITEIKV